MSDFFAPEKIVEYVSLVAIIFFCMPVHEYAHARVAVAFGDDTPYKAGRLSLNPFSHLDPLGTIAFFFLKFGWAKPVPINSSNFVYPRLGRAATAFAGPLSNFLMSLIFAIIYQIAFLKLNLASEAEIIIFYIAYLNTWLGVLNLLPFLPFDGGQIISTFLPNKIYAKIARFFSENRTLVSVLLIVAFYLRLFDRPMIYLSNKIFNFFSHIAFKLVNLFI